MDAARKPEHDATKDVGVQGLLSLALLEGLAPVDRSEFEHPMLRPAWQETEKIAEVSKRLDLLEATAREQGDEDGVDLGTVVAAGEEPVLSPNNFPPEVSAR